MSSLPRSLLPAAALVAAAGIVTPTARAQEDWQEPQPPCEIRPGNRYVSNGIDHLKKAAEATEEERRARRLDQAFEVLTRALRDSKQRENPAAWYYLGRYYIATENAWGADSSMRRAAALAPECEQDAQSHVATLHPAVLVDALRTWQEGKLDSATALFHLAQDFNPSDANVPLYMGMMYASQNQLDSASKYVELGAEVAGGDPTYDQRQKRAMLDVARGYERVVLQNPALRQATQNRLKRDSLERALSRDSTMLAELVAQWLGKQLRPEVAAAVARDSTTLENRITAAQSQLDGVREAASRDSAAADAAIAGASRAYTTYLATYPDDTDAALRLLRLYSRAGRSTAMETLIAQIGEIEGVDTDGLVQGSVALINDGHHHRAIQLLELATQRNPHYRSALFVLTRAYYTLRDGEQLMSASRRLLAVDPLNPQSVRMMAAAWELGGNRDSTRKYVALADSGVGWAVNVTQFSHTATATVLNGSITNIAARPLEATTLVFEFLGADGSVIATATAEVPPLQPRGRHPLALRTGIGGAIAWRYERR